jgi:hypothetical protein
MLDQVYLYANEYLIKLLEGGAGACTNGVDIFCDVCRISLWEPEGRTRVVVA